MVTDRLTDEVRRESPFAGDIVICSENKGAGGGKSREVGVCPGKQRKEG